MSVLGIFLLTIIVAEGTWVANKAVVGLIERHEASQHPTSPDAGPDCEPV